MDFLQHEEDDAGMNDEGMARERELSQAGCLPAAAVRGILARQQIEVETLMLRLLPLAAARAAAPVSGFMVGAVAQGRAVDGRPGALYLGANLEFAGEALGCTVHAEQSAVNNAWLHDEPGLRALAVTAPPCGHCRQFLQEIAGAADMQIIVAANGSGTNGSYTNHSLAELLPSAFGPGQLGIAERLMLPGPDRIPVPQSADPLTRAAGAAAAASYAPYTGNFAGVALRTAGGEIVCGRAAENAAFNPTLPAMASALAALQLQGVPPTHAIFEAVLVEAAACTSQRRHSEALLRAAMGDHIELRSVQVPAITRSRA